jgi:hypothetical protein
MNQEIVSYNATKAALVDLTARYKGLVFLWRERYGHLPEYAGVVAAIDACMVPV